MFSVEDAMRRSKIENDYEYRKWCKEIPKLKFKSDWEVKIIPPFGGAVVRFTVNKGDKHVSVYLDCYNELGFYRGVGDEPVPYWEIYPYCEDTFRCDMEDTEELLRRIDEVLEGRDKWSDDER